MMPVAVLSGGKGTRMRELGETVPKPLVEIGGRPILWHVMCPYANQGFDRFVLLLGHGVDRIRTFAESLPSAWDVTCLDTGLEAIGSDDVLEQEPLESLAARGELYAYRHGGFWDCMDTYKDTLLLNELWNRAGRSFSTWSV